MNETNNLQDMSLLLEFNYKVGNKYVPLIINTQSKTTDYNIHIMNDDENSVFFLDLSLKFNNSKINKLMYSFTNDENICYVSQFSLDNIDHNILIIWLLNNHNYIVDNVDENMIMTPIYDIIDENSDIFSYIYNNDKHNYHMYDDIKNNNFLIKNNNVNIFSINY